MTHTKQDKLSIEEKVSVVLDVLIGHHLCPADENDQNCLLNTSTKEISQLITADRKRVALEARLDENNMYIRELTRHYFPSSPSEPHIPLVQFHERIAELKAQQEEVE